MKYKSQKVAYWFFALSMLLLVLQLVYGFVMGFARIGFDNLHEFIPFNTARAVHTNLLVVWLLSGFMGAAYYIIPEEAQRELVSVKLAYVQLISLAVVGVIAVVGYVYFHTVDLTNKTSTNNTHVVASDICLFQVRSFQQSCVPVWDNYEHLIIWNVLLAKYLLHFYNLS